MQTTWQPDLPNIILKYSLLKSDLNKMKVVIFIFIT